MVTAIQKRYLNIILSPRAGSPRPDWLMNVNTCNFKNDLEGGAASAPRKLWHPRPGPELKASPDATIPLLIESTRALLFRFAV